MFGGGGRNGGVERPRVEPSRCGGGIKLKPHHSICESKHFKNSKSSKLVCLATNVLIRQLQRFEIRMQAKLVGKKTTANTFHEVGPVRLVFNID